MKWSTDDHLRVDIRSCVGSGRAIGRRCILGCGSIREVVARFEKPVDHLGCGQECLVCRFPGMLITCGKVFRVAIYLGSQEDPYKLTVLAKDAQQVCVTSADFFFANQQLSIVTCDEEGILRMYHYNPHGKSNIANRRAHR